ncbi:MAG: ABC transporter permease [Janthinobacterium lividum]
MGIFTDNPVLEREVRGRLRLKHGSDNVRNRWFTRVLGLILVYYYVRGLLGLSHSPVQDAREFWSLLVYGVLVLTVLLAPALASTAITQEREQQTWENLATTQLSAPEVIFGKWIGRQIIPWLLILILLPFMIVCAARAGLGALTPSAVVGFLLVTSACYGALGLLCSFQVRRTVTATASALTATLLLCVGTVIVNDVLLYLVPSGPFGNRSDTAVMWLNPFKVMASLLVFILPDHGGVNSMDTEPNGTIVIIYITASVVVTAAALRLMIMRYGRAA